MEKKQAQEQIKQILQNTFDRQVFKNFTQNLLNEIEPRDNQYRGNLLWEAFRDHITQYWRIGKYTDPNGIALDILIIEAKNLSKLDRARTSLRNFVVKHLQKFNKDHALAAFYSKEDDGADWRFSFIKVEHESYKDKNEKVKTRTDLTPAKRYSYLVGQHENSHTAQNQLLPIYLMDYANPTVEEIEQAFSIEKVTDEFYQQYKELYLNVREHLEGNSKTEAIFKKHDIDISRFIKKLLGQIVFLYFLQKKGWLGVPLNEPWGRGERKFLKNLFIDAESNKKEFYGEYLQHLFYDALAKDRKDSNPPDFYVRFNCKIPFLNGGLFEADYDWKNSDLKIANTLFHNTNKNKSGDEGTGILDVFERYNFTIKEDEPLEKEVAVDPEMLGKVFENMLEITERKSKGAFYTPREIVHYMCQESLINFLDNSVNTYASMKQDKQDAPTSLFDTQSAIQENIKVPKTDLDEFVRKGPLFFENDSRVIREGRETVAYSYQTPASIREHAALLDKKLAEIRICDPAIGSGAFPVGLLHEIVTARSLLSLHLKGYPVHKDNEKLGIYIKHVDAWLAKKKRDTYHLKRQAIQESIYGVDRDSSAIDIARLRLWLSLIVDEDDYDHIEALPNLDYKIVRGNSLIGFPENWNSPAFVELERLKKLFFVETNSSKKETLKVKIDNLIQERLKSSQKVFGYDVDFDFKLFFSEVWHEKGGFDIFIGNPPYVRVQKLNYEEIDLYKEMYSFAWKRLDISILFFERAEQLINKAGNVQFISSNQFLSTAYGRKAREHYAKIRSIASIIDFGSLPVFDNALTYVSIFLINFAEKNIISYQRVEQLPFECTPDYISIEYSELSDENWVLSNPTFIKINKLIHEDAVPLNVLAKTWAGVFTGLDKLLLFDKDNLPDYIEPQLLKPVIRAQNCSRFAFTDPNKYIFYPYHPKGGKTKLIELDELKESYPKAYKFIMTNATALKKRKDSRKEMGDKKGWYGLIRFGDLLKFNEVKIVSPGEVKNNKFALDMSKAAFSCARVFSINLNATDIDIYYLLSILNSSTIEFYLHQNAPLKAGGYYSYSTSVLDKIPIKRSLEFNNYSILTKYLLFVDSSTSSSKLIAKYIDQLIDGLVFELYFPDIIKDSNKELLKHLGDLRPISDNMSDEEKLAVIQHEFDRLYDPNHPVRNNLETLDSIEEVRIIKEAIK